MPGALHGLRVLEVGHVIGCGKKSVTLDLRQAKGQNTFRELAATADVVVENFRPGTMERWHLGPDELTDANTRLIMMRITGFGQTGPYRDRAGFGSVAEAMSGLRHPRVSVAGPDEGGHLDR